MQLTPANLGVNFRQSPLSGAVAALQMMERILSQSRSLVVDQAVALLH